MREKFDFIRLRLGNFFGLTVFGPHARVMLILLIALVIVLMAAFFVLIDHEVMPHIPHPPSTYHGALS